LSSAAIDTTLGDEEVKHLVADAIAEVIFYSEGSFGHTLDSTALDETYGSPVEWEINPALTEVEATVVSAQAALSYLFHKLRDYKVQETIRDEASEWSWSLSATLVRDQMAYLRSLRDKALESLSQNDVALDSYASFIATRDASASHLVEPWVWR
jgi:hydrogenase maturation factor HypE